MSNNEGETLRKIVKASDLQVQEFAEKVGMTRQNLNYLFKKARIGADNREKIATFLGKSEKEIFDNQNVNQNLSSDSEKDALRDLVEAQKWIINYQREFITAQTIRLEALGNVILSRLVEKDYPVDKKDRPSNLDAALKEAQADVQEKITEIKEQLGLSA